MRTPNEFWLSLHELARAIDAEGTTDEGEAHQYFGQPGANAVDRPGPGLERACRVAYVLARPVSACHWRWKTTPSRKKRSRRRLIGFDEWRRGWFCFVGGFAAQCASRTVNIGVRSCIGQSSGWGGVGAAAAINTRLQRTQQFDLCERPKPPALRLSRFPSHSA